jgi:hypothetical protein
MLQVPTSPETGGVLQSLLEQQADVAMHVLVPQGLNPLAQLYWQTPVSALQVPACPDGGGQSAFVQQLALGMQALVPHDL